MRIRGLLPKEGEEVPKAGEPATSAASELTSLASEIVRGQMKRDRDPGDSVHNRALELMAEGARQAIQIATSQAKPSDPIDQLVRMREVMKPDTDSGLLKVLMESLAAQQKLVLDTIQQRNQGGSDLDKELAKFERLSSIFERFAGRGGGRSNILDTLLQYAPAILNPLSQMVGAWAAAKAGVAPPPAPHLAAVGPPVFPLPEPAPAAAPNPHVPGETESMKIPSTIVAQLGGAILSALERGLSGDDFAESLVNIYGDSLYDQIARLGQPAIMQALQSVPELWAQLEPVQAEVERFVADFLAYGQPGDEPGDVKKAA
jgi:hypothetical protein